MAIEPRHIIDALKNINADTPIEHLMQTLYSQLPRCVQRAIATLQCTQLETEYKALRSSLMIDYKFDLHQHIRDEVERILKRPR